MTVSIDSLEPRDVLECLDDLDVRLLCDLLEALETESHSSSLKQFEMSLINV